MLEEGVSNHCHERVTVKAMPRSSFEVIKTEFFLQLLMRLFANPAGLDFDCQAAVTRLTTNRRLLPGSCFREKLVALQLSTFALVAKTFLY